MVAEVDWILGYREQVRRVEQDEFLGACGEPGVVYAGFLWSDLEPCGYLERFHQRLLLDFRVGWSAVGFSCRGPTHLGPWSAPTSARANSGAPFGLYLLSGVRLKTVKPGSDLALRIHSEQPALGPFFCDPRLEVSFSEPRDFYYRPPSSWERFKSAFRFVSRGMPT